MKWYYFPLLITLSASLVTFLSHAFQGSNRNLMLLQVVYGIFLTFFWFFIFKILRNTNQARAVAYSAIISMICNVVIIYFLNGELSPKRLAGVAVILIGSLLLYF